MLFGKRLLKLTAEELNKRITPKQIYEYYLDKAVYNRPFSSPFRKDRHPSFMIKQTKQTMYWKDFATGEMGDHFDFVGKVIGASSFIDALAQVAADFGFSSEFDMPHTLLSGVHRSKLKTENVATYEYRGVFKLGIKIRNWNKNDIAYWNSYGVKTKLLLNQKESGIIPISHYFYNKVPVKAEKYAYAFVEKKDNRVTYKIYQPFSKTKKWISNNNYSVWELWESRHSEPSNVLWITSSRKDALVIKSHFSQNAVALQAESVMPKDNVMDQLKSEFEQINLLYDNDVLGSKNWGQTHAQKLQEKFPYLINHKTMKEKDISDLYFHHGEMSVYHYVESTIKF